MRASVAAVFPGLTEKFEGRVSCMYLDIRGIVTTGLGNALFLVTDALSLPWTVGSSGPPATPVQIADEYDAVKSNHALATGGWKAAMRATSLRLSDGAINALLIRRASDMWCILEQRFDFVDASCADAQLGLLCMSWADGAMFVFPKFEAALRAGNLATFDPETGELLPGCCAYECVSNVDAGGVHNAGLVARNAATRKLFIAAQKVVNLGDAADPETMTGWP